MKPVWIVDDDQAIRWVLEKALGRAGISTRSFSSAADVCAALKLETPGALVSDIRMPGASGHCGPMTEAVATSSSKSASETLPETE